MQHRAKKTCVTYLQVGKDADQKHQKSSKNISYLREMVALHGLRNANLIEADDIIGTFSRFRRSCRPSGDDRDAATKTDPAAS